MTATKKVRALSQDEINNIQSVSNLDPGSITKAYDISDHCEEATLEKMIPIIVYGKENGVNVFCLMTKSQNGVFKGKTFDSQNRFFEIEEDLSFFCARWGILDTELFELITKNM
ncbi:hypothetical protein K9M47_00820 [Candidatus Gracilibacteria bacterium]|nr:hypothetical protein [Candidatus Gracilibacteria bacterium]MCF7898327.1 hypothetical protein [Candidatus Paceibacterota bacterium]